MTTIHNITQDEFEALREPNPGAILGQQNIHAAYEAHLTREAEVDAAYWKNQAEGNKRMQYARPEDEMRADQMDNAEYIEFLKHVNEGNKRMKASMDAMPMGTPPSTTASALGKQIDGGHYKDLKIQPIEFIHANNIPFAEGCAIKYLTRWRSKGGIKDLEKAKHFIELLIELESRK
jgi:hypothetical protein